VRFVSYPGGIYVVKELSLRPARRDYQILRELEDTSVAAVTPVGLVEDRTGDPEDERSAALITRYADFSFSYRELLEGPGFGARRVQMLDAFALLLVNLHLHGCFWGDCSLSNVLYRFDADAIETIMVDAETAEIQDQMTEGRRHEDVEIMIENVAGGMADIAAAQGFEIDRADLALGEDIAARYLGLWQELNQEVILRQDERYRIQERVDRINEMGFNIDEVDLEPVGDGDLLRIRVKVGGRSFHATRLEELTGVRALEHQARHILGDYYYFQAQRTNDTPVDKAVAAVRWRVSRFEPMLRRLAEVVHTADPIQAYCDLLHHRYLKSIDAGEDIGTEAAFDDWMAAARPGYPLAR
jgi:hypothetical protein